jgi:hypothetical protein
LRRGQDGARRRRDARRQYSRAVRVEFVLRRASRSGIHCNHVPEEVQATEAANRPAHLVIQIADYHARARMIFLQRQQALNRIARATFDHGFPQLRFELETVYWPHDYWDYNGDQRHFFACFTLFFTLYDLGCRCVDVAGNRIDSKGAHAINEMKKHAVIQAYEDSPLRRQYRGGQLREYDKNSRVHGVGVGTNLMYQIGRQIYSLDREQISGLFFGKAHKKAKFSAHEDSFDFDPKALRALVERQTCDNEHTFGSAICDTPNNWQVVSNAFSFNYSSVLLTSLLY